MDVIFQIEFYLFKANQLITVQANRVNINYYKETVLSAVAGPLTKEFFS